MMLPRLILPWAKTSELSANSRLHWRKRHAKVKAQKHDTDALAREARWHLATIPADAEIRISLTFCPPSSVSTFDDDNAISAAKGALDALAAVLGVNDRQFRIQAPIRGERCKSGAVIIEAEVCT